MRVFTGRTSVGVRGIRLARRATRSISLSILRHEDVPTEQRYAYLRLAAERRAPSADDGEEAEAEDGENGNGDGAATLSEEQYRRSRAARGIRSDHHREGLRQAHLGL